METNVGVSHNTCNFRLGNKCGNRVDYYYIYCTASCKSLNSLASNSANTENNDMLIFQFFKGFFSDQRRKPQKSLIHRHKKIPAFAVQPGFVPVLDRWVFSFSVSGSSINRGLRAAKREKFPYKKCWSKRRPSRTMQGFFSFSIHQTRCYFNVDYLKYFR